MITAQDILDSIEFARGSSSSKWGSVRAAMGHHDAFNLEYVAIGNEDCGKEYYQGRVFTVLCSIQVGILNSDNKSDSAN